MFKDLGLPWLLSDCPGIIFFVCSFLCLNCCVIERCGWELSTVQRWVSNSQYWQSYGSLIFFNESPKYENRPKLGKIGPLDPSCYLFLPPLPCLLCIGVNFPRTTEPFALRKITPVQNGPRQHGENNSPILIQPISQPNMAQCTLCWQFNLFLEL